MDDKLRDPKYVYADILIALANADETVDPAERELLDGIFGAMGLDADVLEQMWLTPRTLDVVASILADVDDARFKRCLLKDCYLLAHADERVDPRESRFITRILAAMDISAAESEEVKAWVQTALAQKQAADRLFG